MQGHDGIDPVPLLSLSRTRLVLDLLDFFRSFSRGGRSTMLTMVSEPGCFARGRERTRGRAGRPLTGCLPWAAVRAGHFPRWAAAHKKGRAGWINSSTVHRFSFFSEVIFQ
jgi:hypothetical protein